MERLKLDLYNPFSAKWIIWPVWARKKKITLCFFFLIVTLWLLLFMEEHTVLWGTWLAVDQYFMIHFAENVLSILAVFCSNPRLKFFLNIHSKMFHTNFGMKRSEIRYKFLSQPISSIAAYVKAAYMYISKHMPKKKRKKTLI